MHLTSLMLIVNSDQTVGMFIASLILIVSTGLLLYYLQVTCHRILRKKFAQDFFVPIVAANRLEFPSVQKAVEEFREPVDHARTRMTLKCDFLALTYLLKNAANIDQRYSRDERLLMFYFRALLSWLVVRHWLGLREAASILKLTAVLQYFANVVGERVNLVRFGNLAASEYLSNL